MAERQGKKASRMVKTPRSSKGLGDFYGTGVRAPLGRSITDSMIVAPVQPKKLKKPPRSVV